MGVSGQLVLTVHASGGCGACGTRTHGSRSSRRRNCSSSSRSRRSVLML